MILSEKLVKKGFAYEKLRSLYFDISRFSEYGKLSGVNINKIKIGATVDLNEYEKDNPRDFTLLKRSRLSELKRGIYTKTEWGNVRPSWHIQCAAMSMKYLGDSFDIHTGAREFVFPHHENETAIAGALTGKPLARYWLHCEPVMANGKKMNRQSTGLNLKDLHDMGFSNRVIRYWLLLGHYRKPITFSESRLQEAKRSLGRLDACIHRLQNHHLSNHYPDIKQLIYDLKHGFISAMDSDLNISAAVASMFNTVKRINKLIFENKLNENDALMILDQFRRIDSVLNIFKFDDTGLRPEVQRMLNEREKARRNQNWALADRLREQLQSSGVIVQDAKIGGDNE